MRTIAALLIAITLAFGGLVAPAQAADEPIPPECEETVQEWKIRAHAAEDEVVRWQRAYFNAAMELRAVEQRSAETGSRLNAMIDELNANITRANAEFNKVWKRAERRKERIDRLRKKIRELRRR